MTTRSDIPDDAPSGAAGPRGALAAWRDELVAAVIFLTRLPVRWPGPFPNGLFTRCYRAFPLVGAAIGLAGGAVFALAAFAGLPPTLAALLAVASQVLLTGALHEDGLADVADGFGGGRDPAAKLGIMRDSRIGGYGALALVLAVLARVLALAALSGPAAVAGALTAAGAGSRAAMPALMLRLEPARRDGLAAAGGAPPAGRTLGGVGLAALIAVLALGFIDGLIVVTAGAAATVLFGWLARRQIGGYTGDVLGAAQQIVEIVMLLVLVARS
jgi:adenosylcobinamide-GDP ribazoletransferase